MNSLPRPLPNGRSRGSATTSGPGRVGRLGKFAAAVAGLSLALVTFVSPSPVSAGPTIDGAFDGGGYARGGTTTTLRVAGRGGVPSSATAVALNLTVTETAWYGWATVWACGTPRPNASNINFTPGATIANSVITKIGTNGDVCIYTDQRTHVIIDVAGYFAGNSGYTPITPARLVDTRPGGATIDGSHRGAGRANAGTTTTVRVAGRGGVPSNARAVALNLTVTDTAWYGWATVWACGTPRPNASNINFTPGATIANSVITKIGTNGDVCIYTDQATHLIADVAGHFANNSGYAPLTPARLIDTRPGAPTVDGTHSSAGHAAAGTTTTVRVGGRGGVPSGVGAVALNLTVTDTAWYGWATVWACGTPRPNASNINFTPGATIANSVITKVGTNGDVCIYTDQRTHLIVDVAGHFTGNTGYAPLTPARLIDTRPNNPISAAEDEFRILLDQLRASRGLAPVALDPAMSDFARNWSQTMAATWFHHSGGPYSENIIVWPNPGLTPKQAAAGFFQAWVDSAPHYANMTQPYWNYVGIGFHHNGSGWYGTLEFRS